MTLGTNEKISGELQSNQKAGGGSHSLKKRGPPEFTEKVKLEIGCFAVQRFDGVEDLMVICHHISETSCRM